MGDLIIIRTSDSDGSVFKAIIDALQGKTAEIVDVAVVTPPVLVIGEIEIHPAYHKVIVAGKELPLNHGEFAMLYCMAKAPGQVFTREQLYAAAWDEIYPYGSNTVENTIFRLRQKLEPNPKRPTYIKTVFRVGYKIEK
jgi:DNA-binding response OmpR family regulator